MYATAIGWLARPVTVPPLMAWMSPGPQTGRIKSSVIYSSAVCSRPPIPAFLFRLNFDIPDANRPAFESLVEEFVEATRQETGCLYYGFCFNGGQALCREGYVDGDAFLAHLDNVGELFARAQKLADVTRMELHGPAAEIDKLREPLAELDIVYYTLETGFRA